MNAFRTHRSAFEHVGGGRTSAAGIGFAKALREFDAMLGTASARKSVAERATLIPACRDRGEELAGQLFDVLPHWLCEAHFERFCEALYRLQTEPARIHWQALVEAAHLPRMTAAVDLGILREQMCQRFQITHDVVTGGSDARAEALRRAERILSVDSENDAIRRFAVEGYAEQVRAALKLILPAGGDTGLPPERFAAGKRQRLQAAARRAVRRLRIHLSRGPKSSGADVALMVEGYRLLCSYHAATGDAEAAIRLARRARRLRPGDAQLARWARRLRRLRRSA